MKTNVLGIDISFENYQEMLSRMWDDNFKTFTCVNVNYLNLTVKNKNYRENLRSFDIIHPDGIGAKLAAKILGHKEYIEKIGGSDFYLLLFEKVRLLELPIYILGDKQFILDKAVKNIKELFPGIIMAGYHHGYIDKNDRTIVEEINRAKPFLLLVGMGAPQQEEWVIKWKDEIKANKILVIGGGLRVLAGKRKRGPLWMRKLSLEWVVRLVTEPRYCWRRYIIGIPLFLYRVFRQRYKENNFFRSFRLKHFKPPFPLKHFKPPFPLIEKEAKDQGCK